MAKAQQLPIIAQYQEYNGYINPAAVHSDIFRDNLDDNFYSAGISHRSQWIGNLPAATSWIARFDWVRYDPNNKVHFLLGGSFLKDEAGPTALLGFYGKGAVFLNIDDDESFIGLGFSGGLTSFEIRTDRLAAYNLDDPLLSVNTRTNIFPEVGAGLFGAVTWGEKKLFGGISLPQLFNFNLDLEVDAEGEFTYERVYHLFYYGGLFIPTSREDAEYSFIQLSSWLKQVPGLETHMDLNFKYQFINTLWIGAGISTSEWMTLQIGGNSNQENSYNLYKIGASFTFPFNTAYGVNDVGTTYEINLSIALFK